jgi:site-specific DNA recombinase
MLLDGDGSRMTPSHAVKKGTRYRYYVSRPPRLGALLDVAATPIQAVTDDEIQT